MDGVAEQGREAVTTVGGWLVRLLPEGLQTPLMAKIASSSIGLLLLGLLVWAARRVVTRYVRDTELRYRARKVVVSLGMVLGAIYVAGVFSDSLRNVTIALGVAGAALALALREVLASVAAWVAIAFGGFFRVGDRIAAGGVMGDVMDIGLTRTTLMECGEWVNADQYNGRIVRIPNAALLSQPIANYSQDFPFVWDELLLPILYGSDLRLAQALVEEIAAEEVGEYARRAREGWQRVVRRYAIDDAIVDPMVSIRPREEGWAELTLRYVVDYKLRRSTKTRLFLRAVDAIVGSGGQVELARSQVELLGLPASPSGPG